MERKSSNKDLHKANSAKKDEFYTQLVDIEKASTGNLNEQEQKSMDFIDNMLKEEISKNE